MEDTTSEEQQEFVTAFLAVHRSLYAYVVSLTPQINDAEEVFQKTSLILWKRWSDYDSSREFLPWAMGIAKLQARSYLSERGRSKEILGEAASTAIELAFSRATKKEDSRLAALQNCLAKLPRRQRHLLERCYADRNNGALTEIARELKLSANALYQKLKRLREILQTCVEQSMHKEEVV